CVMCSSDVRDWISFFFSSRRRHTRWPRDWSSDVCSSDLYGELRKLFSAVTDARHLDVTPRMELIDAVDADGDGRAELLFREISDAGSGYAVYRVGGDQLWQLYEGTASAPGSRDSD